MRLDSDDFLDKKVEITGDKTVCPNGARFRKDKQGFFPEILESLYDERVIWKNRMTEYQKEFEKCDDPQRKNELNRLISIAYNNQLVRKISLNSAYGAMGNVWFRYYDLTMAEAVTTSGQLAIKWVEKAVNKFLNELSS